MWKRGHVDKDVFIHEDDSAKHEESATAYRGYLWPSLKRRSVRPQRPSHSPPARCEVAHEPVPVPAPATPPEVEFPREGKNGGKPTMKAAGCQATPRKRKFFICIRIRSTDT